MFQHLNPRRSIRAKLALSYLIVVLIPVTLVGVLLNMQLIVGIQNEAGVNLSRRADADADAVNRRIDEIVQAARRFVQLRELSEYLGGTYVDRSDMIINYNQRVRSALDWFASTYPNVRRIGIFYTGEHIAESEVFHLIDRYEGETWYKDVVAALNRADGAIWDGPHESRDYRFSLGKGERVCSVFLRVPARPGYLIELEMSLQELLLTEQDALFLKADSGEAVYGGHAQPGEAQTLLGGDRRVIRAPVDGRTGIAYARRIPALGVLMVERVDQGELTRMEEPARRQFLSILLILCMSMLLFMEFMSRRIMRRVERVTEAVVRIYGGDYDVRLPVNSKDELGVLSFHTNELAMRIDHLLNKVLFSEMAAREAELRALQSQINPHFIYNTLETFHMMAELRGDRILSNGLTDMGELMRYNLSSLQLSTVGEELQHVRAYTGVQNLLHNGTIQLEVHVRDELRSLPLPRLMLQPVVENAIVHGLRGREPLRIAIDVSLEGGVLALCVSNDGNTIEPERLDKLHGLLRRCMEDPHEAVDECLALVNIQRRLALRYGHAFALEVTSEAGKTVVELRLPMAELADGEGRCA